MHKDDRELLELAAKASGVAITPCEVRDVTRQGDDRFVGYMTDPRQWLRGWFDPLNNDGDALRLLILLGMDVLFSPEDVEVIADQHSTDESGERVAPWACESWTFKQQDPYAATRRAITRAAAEIGRRKE